MNKKVIVIIVLAFLSLLILHKVFSLNTLSSKEAIKKANEFTSVSGVVCSGYQHVEESTVRLVFRDKYDNLVGDFYVSGDKLAKKIYKTYGKSKSKVD